MKVCITINDVIRRFYDTFQEVYEVYEEEEGYFVETFEENDFEFGELDDSGAVFKSEADEVEKIILNLDGKNDPMFLTSKFKFADANSFFDFLYNQMAFEIFAKTRTSYKNVIEDLHNLLSFFKENNIEVDLVSMEKGNSIPSTLFFLSREKCKINNLRFVNNYDKIWDEYQIVITAENEILKNKRPRRKLFKIETDNNEDINAGISCTNLKQVLNYLQDGQQRNHSKTK